MKMVAETKKLNSDVPDFCRAMMDGSPMPMAYVDGTAHTIRYVNPVFRLLVGEAKQDLVGECFSHALPGSAECLSMLDRVNRTGRAETHIGQEHFPLHPVLFSYVLWPVLAHDGHRVGIMVQVTETTPFHNQTIEMNEALIIGSVRQHELTESAEALNAQLQAEIVRRKQVELEREKQALEIEASEKRYRGLIEAIPQVVWTATPEGTLDFANAKWSECFDIDLDAFNLTGWASLLHPDDEQRTLEAWTNGLESGSAFELEHRLRKRSATTFRWYLSRAVPILNPDGQIVKWFGTSTDVEEQKRAELALFNKQKLESLGVLAGGIAHDFNNLLTGVLGGASLVAESLSPSHFLRPIVSNMIRSSERAAHLTRQMLAYAGKGSFLIERIDINELVRSTCQLIKGSIPNHVHLSFELRQDLPPVELDSGQMQQIAMNLVLNAAESISDSKNGLVIVKTTLVELTAAAISNMELFTGKLAAGPYIVLEVQDNGSGMNQTTRAKILDPFFTTKFTGRGLGLSAVEGILRTQKGALEVRTEVGIGSTFCVYLPAATGKRHHPSAPAEPAKPVGISRVLVVDDEEIVRRTSKEVLERAGFVVREAGGGEEAIQILQAQETAISLVLLDLSMPGMSGKQVMQQIRSMGIRTPILICSGYSEDEVLGEFSGLDIAGVVANPFTARQLASRVSTVLRSVAPSRGGFA